MGMGMNAMGKSKSDANFNLHPFPFSFSFSFSFRFLGCVMVFLVPCSLFPVPATLTACLSLLASKHLPTPLTPHLHSGKGGE